ncbi:MAG: glutaredoxin domain-containing protein [Nitrospinaceae bacterium]|nr:glutaredoxin domain-containing protein [Nitrospinaceae bacterium]
MKDIKMYTTNWCPYCKSAKRFFEEKGWDRSKLLEVGKAMTVPQIVIDGEAIGGYDDLMKLYG